MAKYRAEPFKDGYSIQKYMGFFCWLPVSHAFTLEEAESRIKSWQEHEKQPTKYYD